MQATKFLLLLFLFALVAPRAAHTQANDKRWTKERVKSWYAEHDWMVGANFGPSTAINQLEMWQAETFDPETIDRELGYAEAIGFNTMRVYLHSLAYKADPEGYKKRMGDYLTIADEHGIKTIFVIFDDVWNKTPKIGTQPEPVIGTHNSGWMQDPGDPASRNPDNFPALETYVTDIVTTFGQDDRVVFWDLYNEPGNTGKLNSSMPLLKAVFAWPEQSTPANPSPSACGTGVPTSTT